MLRNGQTGPCHVGKRRQNIEDQKRSLIHCFFVYRIPAQKSRRYSPLSHVRRSSLVPYIISRLTQWSAMVFTTSHVSNHKRPHARVKVHWEPRLKSGALGRLQVKSFKRVPRHSFFKPRVSISQKLSKACVRCRYEHVMTS